MEIVEYKPRYRKAIIDMAAKNGYADKRMFLLQNFIDNPSSITLCGFEKNKFQCALITYPIDKETVFVNYWVSKTKEAGVKLVREALKIGKEKGFKYAEFFRESDSTYHRREL